MPNTLIDWPFSGKVFFVVLLVVILGYLGLR